MKRTCITCGHDSKIHFKVIGTCIATKSTQISEEYTFKQKEPRKHPYCFCDKFKSDKFADYVREAIGK